ncbi:hypothetical protein C8F01DRAFT_1005898 [Mycena amicta]|nr:hypothetical protein C8F01DRAFT_1005898 [Mycena amicta]
MSITYTFQSTRRHDSQDPTIKTPGDMYAIGWHNAQEANKTVAAYAQRKVSSANNAEYITERVVGKLPSLAALYRDHLTRIFPGGAQINQEYADANGVLSFGDILDGDHVERPFHNSLTLTLRRFSNFQHQDKDATTVAFGLWWEAVEKNIEGRKRWVFPENGDHEKTRGGGFMWGKFQIGVDFERAKGLVEIYWRGKEDWHGTLESHDEPNYTRFGTSVQITAKGANAMRATWSPRGLAESQHDVARLLAQSRVVTPADRQESNVSVRMFVQLVSDSFSGCACGEAPQS